MVLSQKAAQIAGLTMLSRLLEPPKEPGASSAAPVSPVQTDNALPAFITEVTDKGARRYAASTGAAPLLLGFYSDGRVRMATPAGKRYSGFVLDGKAVIADLDDDVSFEMHVRDHAHGAQVLLSIDGGPYDGQHLTCEALP